MLTPKNWSSFQHYKDRAPLWIKLHRGLLDNVDYFRLSPVAAKYLPLIWLVASEKDGKIPDAAELGFRLRISEGEASEIISELTERAFLVDDAASNETVEQPATLAQRNAVRNGFGSRHISDKTKREVWERDGGKCRQCQSRDDIEYDHIHPVSKGGNSEAENIQLLCRPCNRRKRVSIATQAERKNIDNRSLEKEKRRDREETDSRSVGRPTRPDASRFDEFWLTYPRRDGPNPRKPAEERFNSLVKTGVDPQTMIDAARELCEAERKRGNIGTRFIPQAITWLNQQRWSDHAAVAMMQLLEASERASSKVHVKADTPQWRAWAQHLGREPPQDRHFGWSFDSEWPPGHEATVSETAV